MRTFLLPDLGEGLVEATVLDWLVAVGDTVERGDPLVEVETAKSAVEIPSPWSGRVAELHAGTGARVEVGAALVTVAVTEAEAAGDAGTEPDAEPGLLPPPGADTDAGAGTDAPDASAAPAAAAPAPGIVGTVPRDEPPRRRVRLTPPREG